MTEFYTYIYYDPSRHNEPFYVGKGSGRRAWKPKNKNVQSRIRKIKSLNLQPIVGIYGGLDEEFAHLLECELISKFGRRDNGTGTLWNFTDGGDGVSGLNQSDEARKKISKAQKGRINSEETRLKISQAKTGIKRSPETIEKIRQSQIGKKKSPRSEETKAKISAAQKGRKFTEEHKANIKKSKTKND